MRQVFFGLFLLTGLNACQNAPDGAPWGISTQNREDMRTIIPDAYPYAPPRFPSHSADGNPKAAPQPTAQTTRSQAAQATNQEPHPARPNGITPQGFQLPQGSGCTGDIARFRAIQSNDYQTGHVNEKVYHEIDGELQRAEALCAQGQSGQASALVQQIKRRHGYPG